VVSESRMCYKSALEEKKISLMDLGGDLLIIPQGIELENVKNIFLIFIYSLFGWKTKRKKLPIPLPY